MPSQKILESKKKLVTELVERFKNSEAGVFVDHCGLTVAEDTQLRNKLREAGVQYNVIKNTLLRFAINELEMQDLDSILSGPTALATSDTDLVASAKVLVEYAKENKKLEIKAGYVEGKVLSVVEVEQLAELPSKEELVAMTLRGLNAPIAGFANVLNANITGLVRVLDAVAKKQAA